MIVRAAGSADVEAVVRILVVVAEEGVLGTEPPVDVEARAELFPLCGGGTS